MDWFLFTIASNKIRSKRNDVERAPEKERKGRKLNGNSSSEYFTQVWQIAFPNATKRPKFLNCVDRQQLVQANNTHTRAPKKKVNIDNQLFKLIIQHKNLENLMVCLLRQNYLFSKRNIYWWACKLHANWWRLHMFTVPFKLQFSTDHLGFGFDKFGQFIFNTSIVIFLLFPPRLLDNKQRTSFGRSKKKRIIKTKKQWIGK